MSANALVLNQAERAHLGRRTTLAERSRLVSVNGLVLDETEVLTAFASATVQGDFANQGLVSGPATAGSSLSFLNDVSGAGDFAGNIAFRAAYSPGNSPETVDFGGGDAFFGDNAVLTMEIGGPPAGTDYDRLVNIDELSFHGTLRLAFIGGFSPAAGDVFDLFDFASLEGGFPGSAIDVVGFDRAMLDFSTLASSGSIRVVPLPAAFWPFTLALAAGFTRRRARRCREPRTCHHVP